MRTIAIDEDLYQYLLKKTERFGETESDVLRRELKLVKGFEQGPQYAASSSGAFAALLDSPHFRASSTATTKFLQILSEACRQKGDRFNDVLNIASRSRKPFAMSYEEIKKSGTGTNPQKIPRTDYWVETNNNTQQKQALIAQVLRVLGYDDVSIRDVVNSLRKLV